MALKRIWEAATLSTTSDPIQFSNKTKCAVNIVTFMCVGAFDGAHAKLQLGATTSAGVARWNDIASTTLSAPGIVNVEVVDGYSIRAVLYGMSGANSSDTSVDGFIGTGTYIA